MISSEVQRTLVKSPPELWAELSDPAALARHLGELGEIRITRTEPERTVEWEAENTTGTVSIQASGWGTKVTLSVNREIVETAPETQPPPEAQPQLDPAAEAESDAIAELQASAEPDAGPTTTATESGDQPGDAMAEAEGISAPEAVAEPTAAAQPQLEPRPRRGFFARLFGRRRQADATEHPSRSPDALAAVTEALAQEHIAAADPFAVRSAAQQAPKPAEHEAEPDRLQEAGTDQLHEAEPHQLRDISAELMAAEEVAAEEVTAVLAAVLDRLGAAHHRPFSRS